VEFSFVYHKHRNHRQHSDTVSKIHPNAQKEAKILKKQQKIVYNVCQRCRFCAIFQSTEMKPVLQRYLILCHPVLQRYLIFRHPVF